jgi:hypothetical protein
MLAGQKSEEEQDKLDGRELHVAAGVPRLPRLRVGPSPRPAAVPIDRFEIHGLERLLGHGIVAMWKPQGFEIPRSYEEGNGDMIHYMDDTTYNWKLRQAKPVSVRQLALRHGLKQPWIIGGGNMDTVNAAGIVLFSTNYDAYNTFRRAKHTKSFEALIESDLRYLHEWDSTGKPPVQLSVGPIKRFVNDAGVKLTLAVLEISTQREDDLRHIMKVQGMPIHTRYGSLCLWQRALTVKDANLHVVIEALDRVQAQDELLAGLTERD